MRLWIRTLSVIGAVAAVAAVAVLPARAADPDVTGPRQNSSVAAHPDHGHDIDFLFGALKAAPDDDSAKAVEDRIWQLWLASGGDTATLLMTRAQAAVVGQDLDLAISLLDRVIMIKPGYVEAWNRRATIYYMKKDFTQSMADLREVLALEPRHFGAMAGLGLILQDVGDDKDALAVYRRALAIHPHLKRIPDLVKSLTEKVEGREI